LDIVRLPQKALSHLQTERGYVDEGGVFLTFRLWGLAGLNVREENGELFIQFWPSTALGTNTRSDEARKVFQTVLDPTKDREHFYKTGKYSFFFRPIKSNSLLEEGKRLLQLLELVCDKLHNVK
jgi:hypothetical protein